MMNTILIADDDVYCVDVLTRFLNKSGFSVVNSRSGEQTLEVLKASPVALCVIDYHLPGTPIQQVIAGSRALSDETHFIIVTGDPSVEAERSGRSLSPDFYFVKPIVLDDFGAVVNNILREVAAR